MLYFIGAGDRIKIGISSNPNVRRGAIQTGNPETCRILLALDVQNDKAIEQLLHSRLAAHRLNGEWFKVSLPEAFRHLVEITEKMKFSDGTPKPNKKPAEPTLQEYEREFETWLIDSGRILPAQWNQAVYPLWYLWDLLSGEFFQERGETTVTESAMEVRVGGVACNE